MPTNFTGSRYDESANGDLRNSTSNPSVIFGKNVTITGTIGPSDPDGLYSNAWQDSAAFDITTKLVSDDPNHPAALEPGKVYDVVVRAFNFAHVDLKFEENTHLLKSYTADNYGDFTWSYTYAPTAASSYFNVAINGYARSSNGSLSNTNYVITLTEHTATTGPLPDFIGELKELKTPTTIMGKTATLVYGLTNQGNADATFSAFATYISKDAIIDTSDTYLGSVLPGLIKAGETKIFETTTIALPSQITSGSYYIGVIADDGHVVSESSETNNVSAALKITVDPDAQTAAREVYRKMYVGDATSAEAEILTSFADYQFDYGAKIGVQNPSVYMNEALGLALSEKTNTGSTAFSQKYGPATLTSMQLYTTTAYHDIFGSDPTSEQSQHFLEQVKYFENLYQNSGAFGTDQARIDLMARGAVFGQMVGIKAEMTSVKSSPFMAFDYDLI